MIDRLFLPGELFRPQQSHLLVVVGQLVNHRTPATEVSDVVVRRRTIDELQKRRRASVEDREEQPEAEGIGVPPDRSVEIPRRLSPDLPQRLCLSELGRPRRSVDVGRIRTVRIVKILRQPALPRRVLARDDTGDHGNREFLQDRKVVRRPAHDLADDAARPDADAGRTAVRRHEHQRNGQDVRQQQRQCSLISGLRLLPARDLVGNVVVTAVCLEPNGVSAALLPERKLIAYEADLLPEIADHAGRGMRRQLDDRGNHLDDPAVKIDRPSGGQLQR